MFVVGGAATATGNDGKPYTAYLINIQQPRDAGTATERRTIARRYNQFAALHKQLIDFFPKSEIPKLTSKKFIGNRSKETVEKRRVKLQLYLNQIGSKSHLLYSDMVQAFLSDAGGDSLSLRMTPKQMQQYQQQAQQQKLLGSSGSATPTKAISSRSATDSSLSSSSSTTTSPTVSMRQAAGELVAVANDAVDEDNDPAYDEDDDDDDEDDADDDNNNEFDNLLLDPGFCDFYYFPTN